MKIEVKIEEHITTSKSFEGKITLPRAEYRELIRLTVTGKYYNYQEFERKSMIDHVLALEEECFKNHVTEEELRRKINIVIQVGLQVENEHGRNDSYDTWFRVVPSFE